MNNISNDHKKFNWWKMRMWNIKVLPFIANKPLQFRVTVTSFDFRHHCCLYFLGYQFWRIPSLKISQLKINRDYSLLLFLSAVFDIYLIIFTNVILFVTLHSKCKLVSLSCSLTELAKPCLYFSLGCFLETTSSQKAREW